jgi:hypothetical protein
MAAQGQDAAARPPNVAQQALDDRRGADHLRAGRVVGPTDGIADRAGAFAARVARQGLRNLDEDSARATRGTLDHLGRSLSS